MIEIVQVADWDVAEEKRGLPKNIKQIGSVDVGDRIYIENSTYQKMHLYGRRAEKMVYVLLGRFDECAGCDCVFIENAIEMSEVVFNGSLPLWKDESWAALYRKLRPEHEDMVIVGWAVDICGQSPHMTAQLEFVHQSYFGGVHQVLLLMDTLEHEESFYGNRNGYLKRRSGFYVYYDKVNASQLERSRDIGVERQLDTRKVARWEENDREKSYREYLNSRNANTRHVHSRRPQQQPPQRNSYLPTLLLLAVVAGLSYSAVQNYQEMNAMRQALSKMNEMQVVMQTEVAEPDVIRVEEIVGSIEPATETKTQEQTQLASNAVTAETETVSQEASQTEAQGVASIQVQSEMNTQIELPSAQQIANSASEVDTYLNQGYYIVQSGDNLAGISRKIYHTTAMMDEICEINEIENADAIYVGQYLELPK